MSGVFGNAIPVIGVMEVEVGEGIMVEVDVGGGGWGGVLVRVGGGG